MPEVEKMEPSELGEFMVHGREMLAKENAEGGSLGNMPCPFCAKPRSQRSFYIRCQPCGLNWLPGDPMDKHPRSGPHGDKCLCRKCRESKIAA
jgi:hypothetical protein